jgi:hypothetical protein
MGQPTSDYDPGHLRDTVDHTHRLIQEPFGEFFHRAARIVDPVPDRPVTRSSSAVLFARIP